MSPTRWPSQFLLLLIRGYRFWLSPWIGQQCRFVPSCSLYTAEAIERHGALAGSYLGARRLLRCHPWCDGGHDPVPDDWRARPTKPPRRTRD